MSFVFRRGFAGISFDPVLATPSRAEYHAYMPIRFLCPSCAQPIEVDEEWGGKLVACPFCEGTVTAASQSTLLDTATNAPVATLQRPYSASGPNAAPGVAVAAIDDRNTFAVVAAFLCSLVILLLVLSLAIQSAHSMEMQEFSKELTKTGTDFGSQMEAAQRFMENQRQDGITWIIALGIMQLMMLAGALCALIFGILGLTRPRKRALAGFSVTISGVLLILSCVAIF